MPRDSNGPVEMIINPAGIPARKNVSQLIELNLSEISKAVYKKIDAIYSKSELDDLDIDFDEIRSMLTRYYGDQYDGLIDSQLFDRHNLLKLKFYGYNVGCYSKIDIPTLESWLLELGVQIDQKVFDPVIGRTTRNPVTIGSMYIMKLYHMPEYSGKVTPSIVSTAEPVMGKGKFRPEGQSLGEMEGWALRSHNIMPFYDTVSDSAKSVNFNMMNNLLMLGFKVVHEKELK